MSAFRARDGTTLAYEDYDTGTPMVFMVGRSLHSDSGAARRVQGVPRCRHGLYISHAARATADILEFVPG